MVRFKMAAGLLALAAAGHAIAIPHHADPGHGGPLQAVVFGVVAVAQLLGAATLARGPQGNRRVLVLGGSVVLVGVWALSRTLGLPDGLRPGEAEAVGVLDALTVAAELGVVGLLTRRSMRLRLPMTFASVALVVGLATVTAGAAGESAGTESHGHASADHDHARR